MAMFVKFSVISNRRKTVFSGRNHRLSSQSLNPQTDGLGIIAFVCKNGLNSLNLLVEKFGEEGGIMFLTCCE